MIERSHRARRWQRPLSRLCITLLTLGLAACTPAPDDGAAASDESDDLGAPALDEMRAAAVAAPDDLPETHSLLGEPLFRPELDPQFHGEQEMLLQLAVATYTENRANPEGLIWIGRRLAYLGFYRQSQ